MGCLSSIVLILIICRFVTRQYFRRFDFSVVASQLATERIFVCFRLKNGVCVRVEFCREVTDLQMPQVASVILPEMYKIFTQQNVSCFFVILISFIAGLRLYCVSLESLYLELSLTPHPTQSTSFRRRASQPLH